MSDYLFMLDNHLDAGQNRAVAGIQQIATASSMNVWLTGGAMRDMLRGAPIRDLDFTVERDAVKTGKSLAASLGGHVVEEDPLKRWVELLLPEQVRVSVSNCRTEKYSKPGGKPQIAPATIQADLARRDLTINAIALSLSRGSRGLLIDPVNGQADLLSRELRLANPYALFDDPSRIFRLFRFQHVLGFTPVPRTESQLENALLEEYQAVASTAVLAHEIRAAAAEGAASAMLESLDGRGLLKLLSTSLTGAKLNISGLQKFERLAQAVLPPRFSGGWLSFLSVLTEKLNSRDKTEIVRILTSAEPGSREAADWKKLDAQAKKLEEALSSTQARRPSQVWEVLQGAASDEVLLVLYRSTARVVQDRIRAYYEKYAPIAQDVTDDEVEAAGGKPGTPRFDKVRKALITARLNARPPKPEEAEPEPAPLEAVAAGRGRK